MSFVPWSKGNPQRKFVDLIHEATYKWANWDPPKVIQVSPPSPSLHHCPPCQRDWPQIGDFGVIDKRTGELKIEGNIYTHPEIKDVAKEFPVFEAAETDLYQIHSQQVERLETKADSGK